MSWRAVVLFACVMSAAVPGMAADERSFADLLSQAEAQAAAGHRWAPPGDNMTETVAEMMDLISTATPQQLTRLSTLLEENTKADSAGPHDGTPATPTSDASKPTAPASGAASLAPAPAPPGDTAPPANDNVAPPSEHRAEAGESSAQETNLSAVAPAPNAGTTAAAASPLAAPVPAPSTPAASTSSPASEPTATPAPASLPMPATPPAPAAPMPGPSAVLSGPEAMPSEPQSTAPIRPVAPAVASTTPSPQDRLAAPPSLSDSKAGSQISPRPGPRAKELFYRGQEAEREGNVSAARRFYASAAQQGDATAARDLGRLYDPAYLKQTALGGIDPDAALARHWYERAIAMGDFEAGPLLEALSMR